MLKLTLFSAIIYFFGVKTIPLKSEDPFESTVGCLKCHDIDNNKINVHLVPHSHDDVGWLKTVDQYYFGMSTNIQEDGVQNIITSVVEALSENTDRRYIQVETTFFWKWWSTQTDNMKNTFKSLVENGQIEMVNGAWSMNDEACSNYQSTIDQFTWGLRIINETLGKCGTPKVGWQIDPFGHSREQASLLAQMGMHGVFFARLDHDDKDKRQANGTLDFAWQGSANLDNSVIFGGIFLTSLFSPSDSFCWDYGCSDDAINDDPDTPNYNIKKKVDTFVNLLKQYIKYYPTRNILIPMGEHFQDEAAEINYINMDKFIKAFHDNTEVNVIYSTPSCYIQAVYKSQPELTLKTDDFFPYSNNAHSFWTGYFTFRPNTKRFEKTGHNILQVSKQLAALNLYRGISYTTNIKHLREAMGIMQHHDAITGTEKQHVVKDYVRLLSRGIEHAEQHTGAIVVDLLKKNDLSDINLALSSCLLVNVSICHISQNSGNFTVVVYNPLSWSVTHYVRLPVESQNFEIHGPSDPVKYDVMTPISNFFYIGSQVDGEVPSQYELVFAAENIPPMGINLYYVSKNATTSDQQVDIDDVDKEKDENLKFGDSATSFEIDDTTNLLKSVTMNGVTVNISQDFYYYESASGTVDDSQIASEPYLFHPSASAKSLHNGVKKVRVTRGNLLDEFHQEWHDDKLKITQIIRAYKSENYIEFDWLVGDIDVDTDGIGKEVITRFTVENKFDNKEIFYTDSNGREMLARTRNSRPDYTYNSTAEPVASNYYPVTSRIVIRDESSDIEVAVLNDRSQGGSCLANGQIELMVHRRMIHDNLKGVSEHLNETEFEVDDYVRGSHYLVIGSAKKSNPNGKTTAAQERILAQKKLLQPWVGIDQIASVSYETVKSQLKFKYSSLVSALPENINILTFEPWTDNKYLLRLEHIMEKDEDSTLSAATSVDINTLFANFNISECTETTLGANQWLDKFNHRTKYSWKTSSNKMEVVPTVEDSSNTSISLTPMQIRTFVIQLSTKAPIITSLERTTTPGSDSFVLTLNPLYMLILALSIVIGFISN